MKCPNCSSEIAPAPRCPRCDWPLQPAGAPAHPGVLQSPAHQWPASGAPPAWDNEAAVPLGQGGQAKSLFGSPADVERVPLSQMQKTHLLFPLGSVVLVFLFIGCFVANFGSNPIFVMFFALVVLLVSYAGLQALRDLRSGVALVRTAQLKRSWRSGNKSISYYGDFEGVGVLKLYGDLYHQVRPGGTYRVCYSPASKLAWSAEAVWSSGPGNGWSPEQGGA